MDDFVRNKLTEWDLSEWIETFRAQRIDKKNLYCLGHQEITDLIPIVGPRARFKRELELLKGEQNTTNTETVDSPAQVRPSTSASSDKVKRKLDLQGESSKWQSPTRKKRCEPRLGSYSEGIILSDVKNIMGFVQNRLPDQDNKLHQFLKKKIGDLEIDKRELVGVFGKTGAGKSTLINTMIGEKNLLPIGRVKACTTVLIKVEANMQDQKYEAEIEFITKEEWKDELWSLLNFLGDNADQEDEQEDEQEGDQEDGEDQDTVDKLSALYGAEWKDKTPENLMENKYFKEVPEFLQSKRKLLTSESANFSLPARLTTWLQVSSSPPCSTMWVSGVYVSAILVWTVLLLLHLPVEGLLQYSAAELLRLRSQQSGSPPAALHLHPDIVLLPRRKYIHRGSRRGFHYGGSKGIASFWSSTRHPPRNTGRSVDHSLTPSNCTADKLHITDHFLLSFNVTLQLSISKPLRIISYRNIKNINMDSLSSCITTLTPDPTSTPDDLVTQYNNGLSNILNTLAPVKSHSVSFTRSAPCFTPHLHSMKSQNRLLERLFRKTSLNIHKNIYLAQLTLYKDSISHAKSQYYSGLICSNAGNTKTLFSVYNRIIQPPDSLPPHMYSSDTWPLVKCVTVRVPNNDLLQHVTLVDLPGNGDRNKSRDKMWKGVVGSCSTVWIVTEMKRAAAEDEAWDILKSTCSLIGNGGECQRIHFICTKSDEIGVLDDRSTNAVRARILQDNMQAKDTVNKDFRKLKEVKKHFSDECFKVFTVSSQEFLQQQHLTPEETEIPKLQEFLQELNDCHSETLNYVSGAHGILSLIQGARSRAGADRNTDVCRELEEKMKQEIKKIRQPMQKTYDTFERCLTEGVAKSKSSWERLLKSVLKPKMKGSAFHRILRCVVQNGGTHQRKKKPPINLNMKLTSCLTDSIDEEFKKTFPNEAKRGPFNGIINTFSLETERLMRERQEYKDVELQLIFLKTEEEKIKTKLDKIIREQKKIIYKSLMETIEENMQECYKKAAEIRGGGSLKNMRSTIENHVRDSKDIIFQRAKNVMLEQLENLMVLILGELNTMQESIELSLNTDGDSIPDVSVEFQMVKDHYDELMKSPIEAPPPMRADPPVPATHS
uniref:nuclear GTPase SLIP-GC-like n=1 Tax=Epinephelus lanceolatus TaxID=310571 RepID=UPI00144890B0|nr:nuclear GTPase SLIP-GC-like [Epinephelus lanceolatus]